MATKRTRQWTCRGCKTRHTNTRLRKCPVCKKARPAKRAPAHMKALDLPYEEYIRVNGGEHCYLCGKGPRLATKDRPGRRLDRDHDHKTGQPRGLLCGGRMGCNRRLGRVDNIAWLRKAVEYLETVDERLAA